MERLRTSDFSSEFRPTSKVITWILSLFAVLITICGPWVVYAVDRRAKPVDGNTWGLDGYRGGQSTGLRSSRRPCIALTFDDGPAYSTTPIVLEELDRRGIRATFFVVGHRLEGHGYAAQRQREILRSIHRRGHLIGSHTFSHPVMDGLNERQLNRELDRTAELIQETIGTPTFLFRPPFGAFRSRRSHNAVFRRGLTPVFWGLDPRDWEVETSEDVVNAVRHELDIRPLGGVLLLHDIHQRTVRALPAILDEIEARNRTRREQHLPVYEYVTVDEFFRPQNIDGLLPN